MCSVGLRTPGDTYICTVKKYPVQFRDDMASIQVKVVLRSKSSCDADTLNASEILPAQSEVWTCCLSVEVKKLNLFILPKRGLAHYRGVRVATQ